MSYNPAIRRARVLISALPNGFEFCWRSLFGEDEWSQITEEARPQTLGMILNQEFAQCQFPLIECVRVDPNPRRSIFRKLEQDQVGVDRA